jgi:phospholipase C
MASLNDIDHFVVLMLENRSFDNLFGVLKPSGPNFFGLTGDETNPDGAGTPIRVWNTPQQMSDCCLPTPDPGELFVDINEQIFGHGIDPHGAAVTMQGFATNYARHGGKPADVMHYFTANQVPALSALANSYAVCDRWHASAPCQTWPNRFFVHTATANGYENNSPPRFPYSMPTIFNALAQQGVDWKIYFHDFPQSLTLSSLWPHLDRFRSIEEFWTDAEHNVLPAYSFIEPRYFADASWPNDMHPPHNVGYGDQLVADVYNTLHAAASWPRTMLIVTFDEHGGCFDHVPPPAATPPEAARAGQTFAFDRYGVRVPAVIASALTSAGQVLRPDGDIPFDHTSIIKTLRTRFGIDKALTQRDAVAPDLGRVLDLDAPSDAGRLEVRANPAPASDDSAALDKARQAPLNDFQQALHEAAAHLAPLKSAEDAASHIADLLAGLKVAVPQAVSVAESTPLLHGVLTKLGVLSR